MAIQQNFPNIKPTLLLDFSNTKALDPRITFTRASEGRFYGTQVAKAEENLLIRSQEFEATTGWNVSGASRSANSTTAPDGTMTADTVTADAGTSLHTLSQISASVAGTQRVFSCFVKANTHNFVQLMFGTDVNAFANFNVTAGSGAVGTVGSAATASIVDAGNGWYRCIITTSSATASATVFIPLVSSATAARFETWTTAGTESVFLWGAQLEQRSAVTAYTPTTTQPITNYIPVLQTAPANTARFDHNPVTGESLGLLIEEQRTNLLLRSEEFENAAWSKVRSSITANTVVAPDGTLTGDKVIENTDNGSHDVNQSFSVVSGTTYTLTMFVKAAERSFCEVKLNRTSSGNLFGGSPSVRVNLETGAVLQTTNSLAHSVVSVGNGWYRISITQTATGSGAQTPGTSIGQDESTFSYTGDGYSGIYIWGAQLEAGAFPTSYIPTVASQVTRSADAASMTGANFSSWYRADEGTLYAEASVSTLSSTGFNRNVIGVTGASGDDMRIRRDVASARTQAIIRAGGATQAQFNGSSDWTLAEQNRKMALAYKVNDFGYSANGAPFASDTSGSVPALSQLQIGNISSADYLNGTIMKLAFYPKRLTNAEIVALTS
jgi:hypothetical protein